MQKNTSVFEYTSVAQPHKRAGQSQMTRQDHTTVARQAVEGGGGKDGLLPAARAR